MLFVVSYDSGGMRQLLPRRVDSISAARARSQSLKENRPFALVATVLSRSLRGIREPQRSLLRLALKHEHGFGVSVSGTADG